VQIAEKGAFCPRFLGGGDTPDFARVFSNRTYFRPCGRFWLCSVQRARGSERDKERRKRRRIAV